jgi:hypothetical protein
MPTASGAVVDQRDGVGTTQYPGIEQSRGWVELRRGAYEKADGPTSRRLTRSAALPEAVRPVAVLRCQHGHELRSDFTPDERAGFTPRRPPEWDVAIFKYGDEIQTAPITVERNRRTFAWKCWELGPPGEFPVP